MFRYAAFVTRAVCIVALPAHNCAHVRQTDGKFVHEAEKGERMIRCQRCEGEGSLPPVMAQNGRFSQRDVLVGWWPCSGGDGTRPPTPASASASPLPHAALATRTGDKLRCPRAV